jgi:hypothetical protein
MTLLVHDCIILSPFSPPVLAKFLDIMCVVVAEFLFCDYICSLLVSYFCANVSLYLTENPLYFVHALQCNLLE